MVGCTDFVIQSNSKDIAVWRKKKTISCQKHGEVRLKCQEIHTTLLALFYAILRCNLTPGILGIEIAHSSIFNSIHLLRGSVLKEVGVGQMKRVSLTLFTVGQTLGIVQVCLKPVTETIQIDRGKCFHINTQSRASWQPPFLFSLKFPLHTAAVEPGEGCDKNNTGQVCNYIFTCWQNSSEKVTSCQVLCFQPCLPSNLPPLCKHLSSLSSSHV